MVPFALTVVTNEYTVSFIFLLKIFISGPTGSDRQENKGMRWRVFAHASRTSSNSVFTVACSSAYDNSLPRIQTMINFSTARCVYGM